jgi:hypothetical protein
MVKIGVGRAVIQHASSVDVSAVGDVGDMMEISVSVVLSVPSLALKVKNPAVVHIRRMVRKDSVPLRRRGTVVCSP